MSELTKKELQEALSFSCTKYTMLRRAYSQLTGVPEDNIEQAILLDVNNNFILQTDKILSGDVTETVH